MFASIPSPPSEFLPGIGVRYYGLMIALGVLAAVWLARRRWADLGNDPDEIADIAVWAVPAGLIGARVYHVVTDWNSLYADDPFPAVFKIWNGGLGIPGGILFGTLAGFIAARAYKVNVPSLIDTMIPGLPLAQAIGRFGNYFNQELFGRPSTLPWAVEIDKPSALASVPEKYAGSTTFHPTFLYESLWNFGVVGLLIWLDSKYIFRRGKILPLYLVAYFTGRLWVEELRIDPATELWGVRVNILLSLTMMVVGTVWFLWGGALLPADQRGIKPVTVHPEASEAEVPASAEVPTIAAVPTIAEVPAVTEVPTSAASAGGALGEDAVGESGPEVDGPLAEVDVAEPDDPEAGLGVDPDERS